MRLYRFLAAVAALIGTASTWSHLAKVLGPSMG
jgi:hypothetical protein